MQLFFNLLTVLLLTIILIFNFLGYLKPLRNSVAKNQLQEGQTYSLTLKGYPKILAFLLKERISFSYIDGKVYLILHNKDTFKKVLQFYQKIKSRERKLYLASAAVKPLIEEDIAMTKKNLEKITKEYKRLKEVLQTQNMVPDFSPLEPLVAQKERETFEGWTKYWDLKREQIINGFKKVVEEPKVNLNDLETRAVRLFGNELQENLFTLYLKIKIFETRLEADTYKLEQLQTASY